MANPKTQPEQLNKTINILHLLPQPWDIYTFAYLPSIIPALTPELYGKYPFLNVTREKGMISVVAALRQPEPPTPAPELDAQAVSEDKEESEGKGKGGVLVDGEVRGIVELGKAERWYGPWKAIKIRGPLYMGMTGILNELTIPLRKAEIGTYAISTWPTDYVLVPSEKNDEALSVLAKDGWMIIQPRTDREFGPPL